MASFTGSVARGKDFSTAQWQRTNESTFIRTKSRGDTTTKVKYVIEKLLEEGGFGKVYKLTPDDHTKKCKAIKICKDCQNCQTYPGSSEIFCALSTEHKILESFPQSDGLPKPPKAFFPYDTETNSPASIILHLYDFDFSLNFHFKLTEIELLDAFRQFAMGLERLHSEGIYHKDIGPGNMMYDLQKKKAVLLDPQPMISFCRPEFSVESDVIAMGFSFKLIFFPKLDKRLILAHLNWPEKVREILDSSSDTSTISSKLEGFYKSNSLTSDHPSLRYITEQKKFDLEIQFLLIDLLKETNATGLLKALDKIIATYNAKSQTNEPQASACT